MSSVLIRGMKMPEKCGLCDLFHVESPMHCTVVKGHKTVGAPYGMPRPEWCPLVALPDKHGRLIDERVAYDKIAEQEGGYYMDMDGVGCGLEETPTVIEAEGDEE